MKFQPTKPGFHKSDKHKGQTSQGRASAAQDVQTRENLTSRATARALRSPTAADYAPSQLFVMHLVPEAGVTKAEGV